jgi:hypothetical protein
MSSFEKRLETVEARDLEPDDSSFLPTLPRNTLDWIEAARPNIGNKTRNFNLYPYWLDIYEDNHPNIQVMAARQTFKTTACSDILACAATSIPNIEISYIVDNEAHRTAFSNQRLRRDTFLSNPVLKQFLPHGGRANVGTINMLNNSVIYLLTDEREYNQAEGKSNYLVVEDEKQYQDVAFEPKVMYTLSATKGRMLGFGIGGEAGSDYDRLWQRTDQREWVYDDPYWRGKLQFDNLGNITNSDDELKSILAGRWVAQKPENTQYRGYHIPQTIVPTIPLTIQDAIDKYHIQPELSIEYQQKNFPQSIFLSHTMAQMYKAERRPITPEMVYACMHPYRYIGLLSAGEVRKLKETFKNEIRVLMGVDFGSGPAASSTVVSIIIHWRKSGRYQIVHIESRPQEHQLDQCKYIAELGDIYEIDHGVGDLGYGQIQVKLIQDGGTDSKGNSFRGLGRKKFQGCRTIGDETKPREQYLTDTDEHGTQLGRYQIDKTTSIQAFIDRIGTRIPHPIKRVPEYSRPLLCIPFKNEWETDWLVKDFCSITRKDLSKDPDVALEEDPRQRARKEFNHPPDSVMSIIYCFVADENYREGAARLFGTRRN